jgi:hypothetical protein
MIQPKSQQSLLSMILGESGPSNEDMDEVRRASWCVFRRRGELGYVSEFLIFLRGHVPQEALGFIRAKRRPKMVSCAQIHSEFSWILGESGPSNEDMDEVRRASWCVFRRRGELGYVILF